MTPGFAKPRSELPWLPYEDHDRVIINAHNFTPSGPTLLGNEVAIWCPSLDDSGNGTTTVTDLVGNNDISLTNMNAASDWVNDTDNGGIRAVDFDGVNDFGIASSNPTTGLNDFTISFWMKGNETPLRFMSVVWNSTRPSDTWNSGWGFYWEGAVQLRFFRGVWNGPGITFTIASPSSWNHIYASVSGTIATVYLNGVSVGSDSASSGANGTVFTIGEGSSSTYNFACLLDDIRLFSAAKGSPGAVALSSKRGY